MRRQFPEESGSAIVVSIMIVALMLTIGFATLSWAENGFRTSRDERTREVAFNLAEAVLRAQIREVSRNWPKSPGFPACSRGTSSTSCPSDATLGQTYNDSSSGTDYTWSTVVQDNGDPVRDLYRTALAATQPGYDSNGDGKLWVRAEATVRGRRRRLLAQVQAQQVDLSFPRNTVTAGFLTTTNNGNRTIIDTQGAGQQPGDIDVRCTVAGAGCLNFGQNQVSPDTTHTGYPGGDAIGADDLNTLRGQAIANGTYYASCPANPSGALVFVENGSCTYSGSGNGNTASYPGVLVINNGCLSLTGNYEYFGLVYVHNAQGCGTPPVGVSVQGTAMITGAVAVDGTGGISAGSSGTNIVYNANVFGLLHGYGNAERIPGSWRELAPNPN